MPEAPDTLDRALGSRREFLRGLIGMAFVAPAVSTFKLSGIEAVFGGVSGSTTAMSNSNTAGPNFPFQRTCVQVAPNGGTFNKSFGDGSIVQLFVPNGAFPNNRELCLWRGDLAALNNSLPPNHVAKSGFAVVFQFGDALQPITLTVTNANVTTGDVIFRADQGIQTYPGTVGPGTWTVSFTEDPGFVIATPPATPPAPSPSPTPAPDSPTTPAPGGAGGETGTDGATPASPTSSDPRFTG